jgi:hypothetical protein
VKCFVLAGLVGAVGLAAQAPARVDVSERAVVAAASAYVVAYEKEVAFLVAEEISEHRVQGRDAVGPFRRKLTSELFLTYLPADSEWIAIRDVLDVDGLPTPRHQTVRDLLIKADERSVAKRVARVRFDRRAVTREADRTLVTLSYEEPDQLPLVGGPMGPAPSRGELVIDAATGAVRRTLFTLRKRDIRVRLETFYEFNERLKLWLPSVFHEHYERTGDTREVTTVESRYSNYRRYETSGRIGK